ncbi:MAG: 4Fe-4S ferredoxin [Planctomycetaceae bacterium]|nr:MAG: 4Fe-4S ferredoxin [Planctomycetaceae bacterium]
MRKIVKIDEDKCNGCGLCVPSCAEGAIRIIDGKARLVGENLCDGLGNCLGECPQGAITIEERPADEFDHNAVERNLSGEKPVAKPAEKLPPLPCGCPGSMARQLKPVPVVVCEDAQPGAAVPHADLPSQLSNWPVQLALLPVSGPMWQDADVLIAADCVAFAYRDFHTKLLAGKSLAIACPKLDDIEPYVDKLTAIFAGNTIKSVTVAHMEVPCCSGIVLAVRTALEQAGRADIQMHDITIGIDGNVKKSS